MTTDATNSSDHLSDDAEPYEEVDLAPLIEQLESRCRAAKIPLERNEISPDFVVWTVGLPSGRERRPLGLSEASDFEAILAIPFEKYTALQGYSAIACYEDRTIEATVRLLEAMPAALAARRLGITFEADAALETAGFASATSEDGTTQFAIGAASRELKALTARVGGPRALSLKISGLAIHHHDAALSSLRAIANAAFFQLDLLHSIPMMLSTERRIFGRPRRRKVQPVALQFPKYEYDSAPISLYWYARSANQMPLLQFLAYYQVVEFYFPTCSQAEARRNVRVMLKDPAFRADREADIGRLLATLKTTGTGFGDERAQLRATIQECVDSDQTRSFVTEFEERAAFLSRKTDGLTEKRIPVGNKDADLRSEVADRIYDIRCRIVHTKSHAPGLSAEMLLPFTPQADQLFHDIDLVQFIARRVLTAMSSRIQP